VACVRIVDWLSFVVFMRSFLVGRQNGGPSGRLMSDAFPRGGMKGGNPGAIRSGFVA
jgi:hypothetical protein